MFKNVKGLVFIKPKRDSHLFRERRPNLPLIISVVALIVSIVKPILERRIL